MADTASGRDMLAAITTPAALAARDERSRGFVEGFAATLQRMAAAGRPWTDKQRACLARLYRETTTPAAAQQPRPAHEVAGRGVSALRDLFDRAKASGLRAPGIALVCDGHELDMRPAPEHGKNPGAIYVAVDGGYVGRIDKAGGFLVNDRRSEETQALAVRLLDTFGADPAGVAGASGRLTGRCAFCAVPLRDGRSTAVGYGPTCARRYGLPWGDAKAAPFALAA